MPPLALGPADYEGALVAAGIRDIAVFHRQSTGSTNNDAKTLTASHLPVLEDGAAIVVAETQTEGRGRGSNVWSSPPGSIAFTITAPGVAAARLGVLPLGVGACVAAALRSLGVEATVKWPNDVLIDGRKVCGILCESSLGSQTARVFLGIGINVEASPDGLGPSGGATSLAAQGLTVDRPALVADITGRVLGHLRAGTSPARTVEAWKAVAVPWWGEEVSLIEAGIEKTVRLLDVDREGRLLVGEPNGVVRPLLSGELAKLRAARA